MNISVQTPSARVARLGLGALGGWRYIGEVPSVPKAVCLAVPHTDNLDGLLLVLLAKSVGLSISWMVKDAWAKPPVGWLVRAAGGVPIDRSKPNGMVEQMIEQFTHHERLYLVIPPEGTRKRAEHWRSGFYHIALGAHVPVVPGFLDYRAKVGGFGEPIEMSGDARLDMDRLREFYGDDAAAMARHPEKVGPIGLAEERPRGLRAAQRSASPHEDPP